MEFIAAYKLTILMMGLTGLLLIVQIIIADVVALKQKHTPGYPVIPDHSSLLFRASRAHANTNETIAAFILLTVFGLFAQADAYYMNVFASVYFAGRVTHMLSYYGNVKPVRSIAFGIAIAGMVGLFVTGISALI